MTVLIWLRLTSGHVVAWGAQYQLILASEPADVELNAVPELVILSASLLEFDQRLAVSVSFTEPREWRVELQTDTQPGVLGTQTERVVVHIANVARKNEVQITFQIIGVEVNQPPRIHQRGPGVHPIAAVPTGNAITLFGREIDGLECDCI